MAHDLLPTITRLFGVAVEVLGDAVGALEGRVYVLQCHAAREEARPFVNSTHLRWHQIPESLPKNGIVQATVEPVLILLVERTRVSHPFQHLIPLTHERGACVLVASLTLSHLAVRSNHLIMVGFERHELLGAVAALVTHNELVIGNVANHMGHYHSPSSCSTHLLVVTSLLVSDELSELSELLGAITVTPCPSHSPSLCLTHLLVFALLLVSG